MFHIDYFPLLKIKCLSLSTLIKLYFHFLSNWMGYDRGDTFTFDFEPKGNPFISKSKGKLSPRSYPIQFERKWKHSFLSVLRINVYHFLCILVRMHSQFLRKSAEILSVFVWTAKKRLYTNIYIYFEEFNAQDNWINAFNT